MATQPDAETLGSAPDPRLLVLGPVTLLGARGTKPDRSPTAALECCGWLLRHPGQSSLTMTQSMLVAEGTRRSNLSRLRLWLGQNNEGIAYLPEARTGHIRLHPSVTSDWETLELLVIGGPEGASDEKLIAALHLVRGVPVSTSAPAQWHWARSWRDEMVNTVRHIGLVLCERAVAHRDWQLARWAIAQALLAAPDDEPLLVALLRTEQAAGNAAESERIAYRIARLARANDTILSEATIALLHQAIGLPATSTPSA